ncbi:MAG: NADH-quinone oxidoreductase subunit NuoH [Deltaproteobacteria bacterium]|nr:MAG: NADH-quinone oxidoreductase subunit NuoH [Deltaproteobacteria bacterium]
MQIESPNILLIVVAAVVMVLYVFTNSAVLVWVERKVSAHIQRRPGPFEVGPFGLLQTAIDGLKLMAKQLIIPGKADKRLFMLAPVLSFVPPIAALLTVPFGKVVQVQNLDIGILFILSLAALNVLAILIAGWASANKYSLFGAVRSVAQNIAYEIPLLLSLLTAVLWMGTLNLGELVDAQGGFWFVFTPFGFVAFLIYFVTGMAETNRAPFDLPEAESELTAGFHTEYSGMGFGLFFLGEYTNMILVSAIATSLFLGGYNLPFVTLNGEGVLWELIRVLIFLAKAYFLIFVMIWMRWTFPRVRFDQLLNLCWKVLIPFSLVNLAAAAIWIKAVGG